MSAMAISGGPVTIKGEGVFLVGEFLRSELVVRKAKDGSEFERCAVKMLVGGEYPRTIEFPGDRVPEYITQAARGDVLAVPVYPRSFRDRIYWNGVVED